MKRKEACRTIKEKLAEGQTKQEIYKELLPKVSFKSDLVQWLAQIPSHEVRVKYSKLNMLLFSCLAFVSVLKFLSVFVILGSITYISILIALFVPFFSIYFAVAVWNYWGPIYRFIGILGVIGVLKELQHLDQLAGYTGQEYLFEVLFNIPAIMSIILAFYLGTKMFPYYSFWGKLKEDSLEFTK